MSITDNISQKLHELDLEIDEMRLSMNRQKATIIKIRSELEQIPETGEINKLVKMGSIAQKSGEDYIVAKFTMKGSNYLHLICMDNGNQWNDKYVPFGDAKPFPLENLVGDWEIRKWNVVKY